MATSRRTAAFEGRSPAALRACRQYDASSSAGDVVANVARPAVARDPIPERLQAARENALREADARIGATLLDLTRLGRRSPARARIVVASEQGQLGAPDEGMNVEGVAGGCCHSTKNASSSTPRRTPVPVPDGLDASDQRPPVGGDAVTAASVSFDKPRTPSQRNAVRQPAPEGLARSPVHEWLTV